MGGVDGSAKGLDVQLVSSFPRHAVLSRSHMSSQHISFPGMEQSLYHVPIFLRPVFHVHLRKASDNPPLRVSCILPFLIGQQQLGCLMCQRMQSKPLRTLRKIE